MTNTKGPSMTRPRPPICAAELDLPCRCNEVFDVLPERLRQIEDVERHQGRMLNSERDRLRAEVVRILIDHDAGRHLV